ncbi:MAG: hypothetical protein [Bacteriophage sp.]|nr:MAG: hypothetical protein [Bacteriophage sp.]
MTYEESRKNVISIQKKIARVNHAMENPKASALDSMDLADKKFDLMSEWDSAIREMHSFPEYQGRFKQ